MMTLYNKHLLSNLRIDWNLLHQQKLALAELLDIRDADNSLWGLVEFLDTLEDSAESYGLIVSNEVETE